MPKAIQERLEPAPKLVFPIRPRAHHGRPSKSRPPMSHRKSDLGILSTPVMPKKSAKVVLSTPCLGARQIARARARSGEENGGRVRSQGQGDRLEKINISVVGSG